jgi:PAS domain S-box-containing protein
VRFKYSLSSLILIIVFAVASGSLLLGYFLNVLTLRQTLESREANKARDIYNWINADIRHNIHNISAVTQILKSDPNISNGLVKYEVEGKIEQLQKTINKLQRILSTTNVDFLLVTDLQGHIVYQASENKVDRPNAIWIWGMDEALAGKENLSASLSPFGWTITTLTPLLKGSNQYGVLILGITLGDKFARNIAQATNTQVSFCNPYQILASSWPTEKQQQVDLSRVTNSIQKKQQLFFFDPQLKYSSFYLPIKIVDETACLVINTDTTPISQLLLKKREQLFLSFLVVVIIMLGLGTGLTYIMVRPLRKLQRRADDVIKNYSPEEVPMNRVGNEIDTLSQAMELMLATIQKHMEKLLQAQEEWERTFDTIPALIMILDNQHRIVKANQAMAQAFGYSPAGMVGKLCHQVVHGSEVPPAFCPHSKLLSHGHAKPKEVWLEEIQSHLHLSVTPLYDGSGRLMGCVHVANDITERKLAELALRISEEKYRLLVGQIPSVVFKGYEDWGVDCFDDKIETLTGYSKEDFNSRRVLWRDLILEEELPYLNRFFGRLSAVIVSWSGNTASKRRMAPTPGYNPGARSSAMSRGKWNISVASSLTSPRKNKPKQPCGKARSVTV